MYCDDVPGGPGKTSITSQTARRRPRIFIHTEAMKSVGIGAERFAPQETLLNQLNESIESRGEIMIKEFFSKLWNDEEGAETVEYVLIAALIAAVGVAVYSNTLQGQLTTAASNLGGFISGSVPTNG